jgi:hypothetical protein
VVNGDKDTLRAEHFKVVSVEICSVWGLQISTKIREPNNFEIWGAPPLFEAMKMINDIIKTEHAIKSGSHFNNEIQK